MDRLFALCLLYFLLISAARSHTALSPELYWTSVLPSTPIPSSLSHLLNSGGTSVSVGKAGVGVNAGQGKPGGTSIHVGKGGVHVSAGQGKAGGTTVDVGKGGIGVHVSPAYGKPRGTTVGVGKGGVSVHVSPSYGKTGGTNVGVGKGSVGVHVSPGYGKPGGTTVGVGKGSVRVHVNPGYGKPGGTSVNVGHRGVGVNVPSGGTSVNVGKGGVGVHVSPHGKPVHVVIPIGGFNYEYEATMTQVRDDPIVTLFFLEKDLQAGTKVSVHFTTTTAGAKFLTRSEAEAIPFSSRKFSEILGIFKVKPESVEAAEMRQTLHHCEEPAAKGEKKSCATSLESMVDFVTYNLGTSHVKAVSTVVEKAGTPRQEYTMTGVRGMAGTDNLVACHAKQYAYAVFECHLTQATRAYTVSMVGKDVTAVEAVAVCHADTAGWNPQHIAFQVLKVKPGTVAVCHFLPEDHVVWTRFG